MGRQGHGRTVTMGEERGRARSTRKPGTEVYSRGVDMSKSLRLFGLAATVTCRRTCASDASIGLRMSCLAAGRDQDAIVTFVVLSS